MESITKVIKTMKTKLKILKHIPQGFLQTTPRDITKVLQGPTLLHLEGKLKKPLFISLLLHGNEFSGLLIAQKLLREYRHKPLLRSVLIFIGNPAGCAQGLRKLNKQKDLNRIWRRGGHDARSPEHLMARELLQYIKAQNIYSAVDIHNNTGVSPIYGCINKKNLLFVRLAQTFSNKVVYFTRPDSVLSIALSKISPALVIECGLPGNKAGVMAGLRCLKRLLSADQKWQKSTLKVPYVHHTYGKLCLTPGAVVSFSLRGGKKGNPHLSLTGRFDKLNFQELKPGFILGKIHTPGKIKLINEKGANIFHKVFSVIDNQWIVKSSFIPAMFTKDIAIAKSDCLGYVMRKIPIKDFYGNRYPDTKI